MGKYISNFATTAEFNTVKDNLATPHVSLTRDNMDVHYLPYHDFSQDYLTFVAKEQGTFKLTIGSAVTTSILQSISYSTDNGETWETTNNVNSQTVTITTPTINEGDKVLWKGSGVGVSTTTNNNNRPSTSSIFSSTSTFDAEGNILSLVYGDNFADKDSLAEGSSYNFALLFYANTAHTGTNYAKIVSAKNLCLPIKNVPTCCYLRMFQEVDNNSVVHTLTEAPSAIASESISSSGCAQMFYCCTSLTTAPELQATTLGNDCYQYMFYGCTSLTSITIPNGATSIGTNTFNNCKGLISIDIPNSVTSIGEYAFSGCTSLTSIDIPNSVTSIGDSAFDGTPWWRGYSADTSNHYGNIIYINSIAYKATATTINSATFRNDTISIGDNAFSGCTSLTSIDIPDSVTSIGYRVFLGCSSLTSITIPNSVTSIGGGAFDGCSSLTSIDIPDSVTSIGNRAFAYCSGLTSIDIPNSVTSIGDSAFDGTPWWRGYSADTSNHYGNIIYINSIAYKATATTINSATFRNDTISIGGGAFDGCSGLTSINIPDSVTSIGNYAFYNCSGLTSIDISNGVTSIGRGAFANCSGLTSIDIPSGVTSIGDGSFQYCRSLTSITCNAIAAPTIQSNTFRDVKTNGTLYVPIGSSGYDTWMQNEAYYLGYYNWTKVEQ